MKKIIAALTLVFMLAGSVLVLASCNGETDPPNGGTAASYVNLNINPEISFTVDENGIVLTAVGDNEDGQVLLYGEEGIVGESIESAVDKVVELASEMGYITDENGVVETLVSSSNADLDAELLDKIRGRVNVKSEELGIDLEVSTEGAYTLLREIEALRAEYPENELLSSVSVADYKLALKASESGEITLLAALELDKSELIEKANAAALKIEEYFTDAFSEARAAALAVYEKAMAAALAGKYTAYFTSEGKLLSLPKAAFYQAYVGAASGIESIADAIELLLEAEDYEIDATRVAGIVDVLGLPAGETEKMKDDDGKITLESIEDYLDVYIKNLPEADKAAVEEEIDTFLDSLDSDIEETVAELAKDYATEVETVVEALESAVDAVKQFVSSEQLAALDAAVARLTEMVETESLSADELREVSDDLYDEAETLEAELESGLTEAELELLPIGAIMMTYECGTRFLTDYLSGDTYFKISRPEHNLDRARNQFKLVSDMEAALDEMRAIVKKYL